MANEAPEKQQKLCFVVGPIGETGSPTRKQADFLLKLVIRPAAELCGYRVKRADEDTAPGMISDRIIRDIQSADLVVADLSELNPNAFYELGIRHSTGKPTVHVAQAGLRLPFDNIGHDCLFIDMGDIHAIEAGRERLGQSIERINAPDFKVSNPITQANGALQVQESADPVAQLVAQLMDRVARLEQLSITVLPAQKEHNIITEIINIVASQELDDGKISRISNKAFSHWKNSNGSISAKEAVDIVTRDSGTGSYRGNALAAGGSYPVKNALMDLVNDPNSVFRRPNDKT